MENNQNERKSINLSKDAGAVREAYPRYNNSTVDNSRLQQQEYRNSPGQTTQYQEPPVSSGSQYNAPPVQPANANNPPAQFQNQFGHYYDYNDPQANNGYQNGPQNNQNNMYQNGSQNSYQNGPQNNGTQNNRPQSNLYNNPVNNMFQNAQQNNMYQNQSGYQQSPQQQAMKFCKYCGQQIPGDAVICTHCGRQVEEFVAPNRSAGSSNVTIMNTPYPGGVPVQPPYGMSNISAKSKTAALVLAAVGFCGCGGLHRFYAGKIFSGLIYLFTGGLFGIGTIIDLVRLANNTFTDGAGYIIKKP